MSFTFGKLEMRSIKMDVWGLSVMGIRLQETSFLHPFWFIHLANIAWFDICFNVIDKRLNVRIIYVLTRMIRIIVWIDAHFRSKWVPFVLQVQMKPRGDRQWDLRRNQSRKHRSRAPGCSNTVARRHEESAKSGVSCGQPYGRVDGRMWYCSTLAPVCAHLAFTSSTNWGSFFTPSLYFYCISSTIFCWSMYIGDNVQL